MDLMSLTAVELGRKIKAKEVTVREAVLAAYDKIDEKEAELNCYVTTTKEAALAKADEVQTKIDAGDLLQVCLLQLRTTCAPRECLQHAVPEYLRILCLHLRQKQ